METKVESPIKVGYSILLLEDGTIEFNLEGLSPGTIELLGLHEYATLEIMNRVNYVRLTGDYRTHEVGKAVALLNQKVDQLLQLSQQNQAII